MPKKDHLTKEERTALEDAIERVGNQRKLAKKLDVNECTISRWLKYSAPPPYYRAQWVRALQEVKP